MAFEWQKTRVVTKYWRQVDSNLYLATKEGDIPRKFVPREGGLVWALFHAGLM